MKDDEDHRFELEIRSIGIIARVMAVLMLIAFFVFSFPSSVAPFFPGHSFLPGVCPEA